MSDKAKENISINGKELYLGVLSDTNGNYQMYTRENMTWHEVAFDVMVIIRLLIREGHIKNKKEFDDKLKEYFTDPQYKPVEVIDDAKDSSEDSGQQPTS